MGSAERIRGRYLCGVLHGLQHQPRTAPLQSANPGEVSVGLV